MFKIKKGQGLSMNVIIVAALALLVLIILAMIFTGRVKIFSTTSRLCANQGEGAKCLDTCPSNSIQVGSNLNTECTKFCCMSLDSTT